MGNELFRMLNIRPPRPARVIPVDEVGGRPRIIDAITPYANGRILTKDRLREIIAPAAAALDGGGLDQLDITRIGEMLGQWTAGDDPDPILAAAAAVDLENEETQNVLQLAGDAWLANVLSSSVHGETLTAAETLLNIRRALRGAALVQRINQQPEGRDLAPVVTSIAQSPLAVTDTVGISAALRSAEHPEELDERRAEARERKQAGPDPRKNYRDAETILRKLIDAHGTFGERNQRRLFQQPGIEVGAPGLSGGVFSRLGTFLFGEPADDSSPVIRQPVNEPGQGAGQIFVDSLSEPERNFARQVLGENYAVSVENLGRTMQELSQYQQQTVTQIQAQSNYSRVQPPPIIIDERPPFTLPGFRAGLRIAGIGDLIVARESLKRYEVEEIAHIENVLPLEERVRQHRSVRSSESIFEQQTEQELNTEKDLRTSERFELQSETSRTIETQFGIDFGLNVTANYGFVGGSITVDSSLGINYSRNVTESQNNASKFSNEVVNRSLEQIQKRSRELRRVTLTETIDELNRHAITGLAVPFSGIYKWVNKIQEVELRHFGQRLMLEFYIPEPALRLLRSVKVQEIEAPPTLDFAADQIDIHNFAELARIFEAGEVKPPPPHYVIVETGFAHQPRAEQQGPMAKNWTQAEVKDSLPIPAGYAPISAAAIPIASGAYGDITVSVAVAGKYILGGRYQSGYESGFVSLGTSAGRGDSGVAIAYSMADRAPYVGQDTGALHISILCERQIETWQAWQLDSYQKYYQGNQRQWSAYREALLTQTATTGVKITGKNPLENRIMERDELKRWSIEIMRGRPFDINAIDETGLEPNIAYDRLDGNRNLNLFFEKAFEWTQMTYWLFPYFWGRREQWEARLTLEDVDPLHQNFLRAGSARMLVPVTPGFEERVLYYINTAGWEDQRVVWEPDSVQSLTNPLTGIPALAANPEIWMEVIINKNKELAYGSGTLDVTNGSPNVNLNPDSSWDLDNTDIGRELYIEGFPYSIVAIGGRRTFTLNEPYAQANNPAAHYLVSSVRVGAPWEVIVPTNLVVLADQAQKLNAAGPVNTIDPEDIAWLPVPQANQ